MVIKIVNVFLLSIFILSHARAEDKIAGGASSADVEKSTATYEAQLRLRPEVRNNTDYGGNRNYTLLRLRMSATFKPSSDVIIFAQPQFSKVFAEDSYVAASATKNAHQPTSGALFDTAMTMHQAYLDYRFAPKWRLIGGRQTLSYGDEVLVGAALGWANIGRSFDALRVVYKTSDFQSDVFWSRLVETSTSTQSGNGSREFVGFYNNFNLSPEFKNLDPYVFYLSDTRPGSEMTLWTVGLRMKSPIDRFDYRFEADFQIGSNQNGFQNGNQGNLEVGYILDTSTRLRVAAEGFISSPDFNQLFPAAHRWLGIADVLGRRNVSGGGLKSSMKLSSDWTLSLDLFKFYRTNTDFPAYKLAARDALGSPTVSSSASIGTEVDLNVSFQASSKVIFNAGINTLFPSEYLSQNFGSICPMYAFLELEARY